MLAEVYAQLGEVDAAVKELKAISGIDTEDIATRIAVLTGDLDAIESDEAAPVDVEIDMEEEEMELEMDDDEDVVEAIEPEAIEEVPPSPADGDQESEGDRLAAAGDTDGAIAAYQQALDSDPTNEGVLMKLGELFAAGAGDSPPVEPVESMTSFGDLQPKPSASAAPMGPGIELDDGYVLIRGQIMIGELDAAKSAAEERDDLLGACALAELLALEGDAKQARRVLQEAMDEVDEDADGYPEGLWGLARYAVMVGKVRTASRLLGELDDLAPGHRAADMATLKAVIDR
jgi:tetratricopeptide (TPR) repeat protein